MANVWIPPLCRDVTNGVATVCVPGASVLELLDALELRFPGLRSRLCDGNVLRPGWNASVDGEIARFGLRHPVQPESEVHFLPMLGGG